MKRNLFQLGSLGLAAMLGGLLTSCSGNEPSPDDTYFAGLDPVIVAEVMDNPVVKERIQDDPPELREMRLQGSVINFIVCRDLLRVYQGWMTTGIAPEPNPLPVPAEARADWPAEFAGEMRAATSGDPDQLRQVLTAEGTCGEWIPATPGEPSGPTIKDVVEAIQ